MENIKIIPSYDCLIVCGKEQNFVEKGQTLLLDKNEILSVYPTTKAAAFCLNTAENEDSSFFKVVATANFKVFYLSSGILCENYVVSTLDIKNNPCKIELGNKNLTIQYLQFKKILDLPFEFDKFSVGALTSHAYILLTSARQQDLILFNCENGKVESFCGDEIKITGNNFTIVKNLDDIARHVVHEEYTIVANDVVLNSKVIDYQAGRPVVCTASQTIPYAFLQAIEIGDFDLASSYLDLSMRRKVDKQHLESFFGKVKNFFQVDDLLYAVFGKEKSLYKFTISENKISEIDKL